MTIDHALVGVTSSPDTSELVKALVLAQSQYPSVSKTGNNTFAHYRYLTYSGICEALRGPLNKNGLSIPQVCLTRVGSEWIAVGTLRHQSGQFLTSLCPLYLGVDKKGDPRVDMQSLGSAYTYAKKYLLLGLCGGWAEEDDDGQKTMPEPASKSKESDRSIQIETAATMALRAAKTADEREKVLGRVKLRIGERVCDGSVLERLTAIARDLA